jgi:hypothetical protein
MFRNLVRGRMRANYQPVATATILSRRFDMTKNVKVILSAVGIAAALASPVMAKTRHHATAPSPRDVQTQTVYAPDVPVLPYSTNPNRDFQLGERN